jgi:hypothetical protein
VSSVASDRSDLAGGASLWRGSRLGDRLFKGSSLGVALALILLLGAIVIVLADGSSRI